MLFVQGLDGRETEEEKQIAGNKFYKLSGENLPEALVSFWNFP